MLFRSVSQSRYGGDRIGSDPGGGWDLAVVCDGDGDEDMVERGDRTGFGGVRFGFGGYGGLVELVELGVES